MLFNDDDTLYIKEYNQRLADWLMIEDRYTCLGVCSMYLYVCIWSACPAYFTETVVLAKMLRSAL